MHPIVVNRGDAEYWRMPNQDGETLRRRVKMRERSDRRKRIAAECISSSILVNKEKTKEGKGEKDDFISALNYLPEPKGTSLREREKHS